MTSRLSQSIATHTRLWYLIDARGQVVGRLAVMISRLLQGKTKPIYHPAVDMGDHVVVVNTQHVVLTGNKWKGKLYRHHTGFPGGLNERTAEALHASDPTRLLWKAVNGMLPKNLLRKKRLRRLRLFPGEDHPYSANITHNLRGPSQQMRRLEDYSREAVARFPKIVDAPHL